ncbi:MAG TPA: sodium:proton antiporter [Pirellulaceae bacterium]|nr:sodium:proton antiporter [Pirellulaceae bacterium]
MSACRWPVNRGMGLLVLVVGLIVGGNALPTGGLLVSAAQAAEEGHAATATDHGHDDHGHGDDELTMGHKLPVITVLPFAAILLCIAILPLATPHWWEHNRNRAIVAFVLAAPVAAYLLLSWGHEGQHALQHSLKEYISFILLLGSLYIISGGIYVQGSLAGTPIVNTGVMALGALIASFIGTTGASVLLIRPLLRANAPRERKAHIVVFFIFIVSNCGGLLTPLGDPPLYLGFLNGVPFTWTFQLWGQWLLVNGILLVMFNIYDQIVLNKEELARPGSQLEEVEHHEPLRIIGMHNFIFLGAIVAIIYCSGSGIGNGGQPWAYGVGETAMLLTAIVSYFATANMIREKNRFSFAPIVEVAILFGGIFITMIPAMQILNAHGKSLGVSEPWQFFWASGALSSFLDNAPTYLTFAATAAGMEGIATSTPAFLGKFLQIEGAGEILAAISCGSVFMGANTYIGNGPNFMVKAIAEENGVKMPSFFGYMAYSGAILIPIFILVTFVFFR